MSTWDPEEPIQQPADPTTDELDLMYDRSLWREEQAVQVADVCHVGFEWLNRQRERERGLRHQGLDGVRLAVFDLGPDED